jgi:hypothetical protein
MTIHSLLAIPFKCRPVNCCLWILLLFCVWFEFLSILYYMQSQDSSVGIVSGHGLDYQAIGVWSPAEARGFSTNLCVKTGSGTCPTSFTMATGGKAQQGVMLTTHPHLVLRSWMSRSYTSSPPLHLHRCVVGLHYLHLFTLLHDVLLAF